jgi:FixJ family two-component response regulator
MAAAGEFPAKAAHPLTAPAALPRSVFVIDDDPSVRRALTRQLRAAGFQVEAFASAREYLDQPPPAGIGCIVTDLRMPGLSGLDLQASLAQSNRELPIVFITGHGDIPTSVRAMKAGAVNFLAKPFAEHEILAARAQRPARPRPQGECRAPGALWSTHTARA